MRSSAAAALSVLIPLLVLAAAPACAQTRDYAVEVSATVQESPPRVDFTWPADTTPEQYYVFRKSLGDSVWGDPIAVLLGTATTLSDTDVAAGEAYEYSLRKSLDFAADTVAVEGGLPVTFTIHDAEGDGICCRHGLGAYVVTADDEVVAEGGKFGAVEMTSFVAGDPGDPSVSIVVSLLLDVYAAETTWTLTDDTTGETIRAGGPYQSPRFGHIAVGIRYPEIEDRGAVLLVVADDMMAGLPDEIERLERDLIGDGYRVRREIVSTTDEVPVVKDVIVAACAADPDVRTLFLLGHVPVPYSGSVWSPHFEHRGAWPADVYYGELNGVWTDSIVNNTSAIRPENHNVPGDGKFDQTWLPSDVELAVGRVDLSRMPAFTVDEVELTRRYLDKDHAYRRGEFTPERRGLIDDNVGDGGGTAPAALGWRNFTALFGEGTVQATDYFSTLEGESYLWSYGCGAGGYTRCNGIGETDDFAAMHPQTVFTALFGSYFGDWDNEDNFLRAPLASPGQPLACFWGGRPTWHLHRMALGHTIGQCARLTQNNDHEYTVSDGGRQIVPALMGDPTLKLHVVKPPGDLVVSQTGAGEVLLSWGASPDIIEGYHIYRAPGLREAFERINGLAIPDTVFVDWSPLSGNNVYMVRALKLETTGSGTYYNLSGGVVDSLVVETEATEAPARLALSAPNPFAPGAAVRYYLPAAGEVSLRIYTVSGRLARQLEGGPRDAGWHDTIWDGRDGVGSHAASGVYFLRLEAGGESISEQVTLLR
jgi:hypothetical protein